MPYLTAATEEARHDQHRKHGKVGDPGGRWVDTHGQTHHAAVIDEVGRELGVEFPASPAGYRALAAWLGDHGDLDRVGVEGIGTYGAALARFLRDHGLTVIG